MSDLIVSKYGGSSIASAEGIERIINITKDDLRRRIMVVSAPGKRYKEDVKVTDMLIELAENYSLSLKNKIFKRYLTIYSSFGLKKSEIDPVAKILDERLNQNLPKESRADAIKAFGEEANARLLARVIGVKYVDPKDLFVVSSDFGDSKILQESRCKIKKLSDYKGAVVVPGFYGYTTEGLIATFSRGGSDLTGSYIASALDALVYENFTDVDGVFSASPSIVKNPRLIEEMTYKELRDLAYIGFNIFHQEATKATELSGVPIHIRNTFKYPKTGTYVVPERISEPNQSVVGVAYRDDFCAFNIEGSINLSEKIKILQIFEEESLSVEPYEPGSLDDLSVVLEQNQMQNAHCVGRIKRKLNSLFGENNKVSFDEHLGAVVVAGKGLRGCKGISAKVQLCLANAGINIRFICQGQMERSIIYGISQSDGHKAVNVIYDNFIGTEK